MTNTNELATALDTTPRTLRKFLRADGMGVGKGSRYALPSTKRDIARLNTRFTAWNDARNATTDDAPDA